LGSIKRNRKIDLCMKWLNIGILLLLNSQACRSPVEYLSKRHQIECKHVGFTNQISKSYSKYEKLKRKASYQELVGYSQSESSILRAYAHWALVEKFQDQYIELFEQALQDTTKIIIRCGDTSRPRTIASSAYILFMESKMNEYERGMDYPIYHEDKGIKNQIALMDSLILAYLPEDRFAIEQAIINREYHSDTILRNIIQLAFQEDIELAGQYIKKHWRKASFQNYKQVVKNIKRSNLSSQGKELFDVITNN